MGGTVGFCIGQSAVVSSRTRLMFVTTGWLLHAASLDAGRLLSRASHVVLDEAHERSLDADLLSLVLARHLAAAVAAGGAPPKIVAMSATLQAGAALLLIF